MKNDGNAATNGATKNRLFEIGLEALKAQGYAIQRIPGIGKSSVRQITKDATSRRVTIRTTQDTYISFQRSEKSWVTLPDVDAVVAVSVDDHEKPKFAQVHLVDGKDMRERFDRAYAARLAAGRTIRPGHGVWLPLYIEDSADQASHVGGGAGLANPPICRVPLTPESSVVQVRQPETNIVGEEPPLTIPEAKRRLAISLGVDPSNIKISVEA